MTRQACETQQTTPWELYQKDDINKCLGVVGREGGKKDPKLSVGPGVHHGCLNIGGAIHGQQPPLY